jgi:hypothetical protein
MATTSTSSKAAGSLGVDKHDAEPGFHGHAGYLSAEDLQTRLDAATGQTTAPVPPPLPLTNPAQQ